MSVMEIGETVNLLHGDGTVFQAKIVRLDRGQYVLEAPGIPIPLYLSEKVLLRIIANAREKLSA
jgi:hypothetical protein